MEQARRQLDVRILATDISTDVLDQAEAGEYEQSKLERVPSLLRSRYFEPVTSLGRFKVTPELRQMIQYKRLNLSKPPFSISGPLDMIFCRNVMFYFDDEVRGRLMAEFCRLLRPGGFLLVGTTESLPVLDELLTRVGPAVYQKAA